MHLSETGRDTDDRNGDGAEQNLHCEVTNHECASNHAQLLWVIADAHEPTDGPSLVLHTFDSPQREWVRAVP